MLRKGGLYIIISFSLDGANASCTQAVLAEAVWDRFELLTPAIAMKTTGAFPDNP